MQALLFHAERSVSYGKESDQHSQAQAINGIYRRGPNAFWIRGPVGLGRSTWHRANSQLENMPWAAQPGEPPRVLIRIRRKHASGADAATEYSIDWELVALAIAEFRHTAPEECPLLIEVPAIVEEVGVPERDRGSPAAGEGGVHQRDSPPGYGCPAAGHLQKGTSGDYTDVTAQRRRLLASLESDVANWITSAWGQSIPPRFAYVPSRLLAIAAKVGVHGEAIHRWIHTLMIAKNRQNYSVETPAFFLTAAANDLIRWSRIAENRIACEIAERDHQLALSRLASPPSSDLLSMPETPPAEQTAPLEKLPDVAALTRSKRFGGATR